MSARALEIGRDRRWCQPERLRNCASFGLAEFRHRTESRKTQDNVITPWCTSRVARRIEANFRNPLVSFFFLLDYRYSKIADSKKLRTKEISRVSN
jgi:hypothetical protein